MYRPFAYVLAAASLAACVDSGDEGIQIVKNVAPPEEGCTFTAADTEPFLPTGTVNILSPFYLLNPQLVSRITAAEGQEAQRTIFAEGARVDIEFLDETLFSPAEQTTLHDNGTTHFETRFSAPIAPNGGRTDTSFMVIPPAFFDAVRAKFSAAANLSSTVVTKSTVFGVLGSGEVTSQTFSFPVTICSDCVLNVLGSCPRPTGTIVRPGNPCNPFQDRTIDCCVDSGGGLVCPAEVAQM